MADETKVTREVALSVTPVELRALAIGLTNAGWKPQDFEAISKLVAKIDEAAKTLVEVKK